MGYHGQVPKLNVTEGRASDKAPSSGAVCCPSMKSCGMWSDRPQCIECIECPFKGMLCVLAIWETDGDVEQMPSNVDD